MLTAISVDFDLEEAGVFGGRTGDLGSSFGEPCVEDLSTVPGREDAAVVDRDPIPICLCGRPVVFGGKAGLALLIGPSSRVSRGLFLGIFLGIRGIRWFGLR